MTLAISKRTMMQPNAVSTAGSTLRKAELAGRGRFILASPEQVQAVADADQAEGAEADRDQQHDAEEERLPQRIEIEHEQEIADRAEDKGAEDRANRAAPTAIERDAAQHHGGDRGQGVSGRVVERSLAGIGDEGDEEPADRAEQAG